MQSRWSAIGRNLRKLWKWLAFTTILGLVGGFIKWLAEGILQDFFINLFTGLGLGMIDSLPTILSWVVLNPFSMAGIIFLLTSAALLVVSFIQTRPIKEKLELLNCYEAKSESIAKEVGLVIRNSYENRLEGRFATFQSMEFASKEDEWQEVDIAPSNFRWEESSRDYLSPSEIGNVIVAQSDSEDNGFQLVFVEYRSRKFQETGFYRIVLGIGGMVGGEGTAKEVALRLVFLGSPQFLMLTTEKQWQEMPIQARE